MNLSPETWAAQMAADAQRKYWDDREKAREKLRDDRVKTREHSLRIRQDPDREIEKRLLLGGQDPIAEQDFEGDFVSRNMGGDKQYILQYLGNFVNNHTDQDVLDDIKLKTNDLDNFMTQPFPGHESDLRPYIESEDFDFLHEVVVSMKEDSGDWPKDAPLWESLEMAFHLIERMTILRRFTDLRNLETQQVPLPDGTNLESTELRISWVLHRAWIRALHYRSLYIGYNDYGENQLYQILPIAMALLHRECDRIEFSTQQNRSEFRHLIDISSSLAHALIELGKAISIETRPMPPDGPYSLQDTMLYNASIDRFSTTYQTHFAGLNRKWQLWAHLLAQADDFEKRMDVDHVEDTMMEKRIVLYDEFFEVSNLMQRTYDIIFPAYYGRQEKAEQNVYNQLSRVSEVNRCRRNYLLLRDWAKKRPWKQLYYIFDTTVSKYDYLLPAIREFYDDIARIEQHDQPPVYIKPSPSNLANVWSSLFTFHPIGSSDPPDHLSFLQDGCVICLEAFSPSETIVELFCNHLFHFTCVAESWDAEMVHRILCPLCRLNAANWRLHEQCGIVPEVIDLWENEETVGSATAAARPDMNTTEQSAYWQLENSRIELSEKWAQVKGKEPRDVNIEMAVQRKIRRARNKTRRDALAATGTTVAGLIPRSPPAVNFPPGSTVNLAGM